MSPAFLRSVPALLNPARHRTNPALRYF